MNLGRNSHSVLCVIHLTYRPPLITVWSFPKAISILVLQLFKYFFIRGGGCLPFAWSLSKSQRNLNTDLSRKNKIWKQCGLVLPPDFVNLINPTYKDCSPITTINLLTNRKMRKTKRAKGGFMPIINRLNSFYEQTITIRMAVFKTET